MTDNNYIPDSDLELAREVGLIQAQNPGAYSTMDDYLIQQIVRHKNHIHQLYDREIPSSKRESWAKIESDIRDNKIFDSPNSFASSDAPLTSRQTFLKIAAVFLLTALLTVFYVQFISDQPEIIVQADSDRLSYTLSDGSTVELRPYSTLYAVKNTRTEIRYRLEGEAFFNVTKKDNQRFVVEAGTGIIEVVGTAFNLREWGSETVVFLKEGSVLLSSVDGTQNVTLKPGEAASVTNTNIITEPVKTDGSKYTSWQNNELIFNNRTAGSIFNELEHHYSIKIIASEDIRSEVLGGSLTLENRNATLNNLELVLGGNFSSIGDDTYQFVD